MAHKHIHSLLLLLGLCIATEAGLLGTTECTYGPAYWCGSLRNAKQCSAVTHCIQTVWEKQQLPEDHDTVCDICKDMVQQARDTLQSNQTQEELKEVFEGSCRLIPLREIVPECIELADEFIPELVETLSSQMNPAIVCATAGLCNSVRIDRMLREHGLLADQTNDKAVAAVSDPDPGDCADCHHFVKDTIALVKEHSKSELMDHLMAICSELGGSVSDGCSALVSVNIDVIYSYLTTQLNADDVCTLFGMCGDMFEPMKRAAKTGDEACDFCVAIAQHWRDMLTANTSREQFIEVLEGICQQTGSFSSECKGLVDQYGVLAYDWLVDEFDPKDVCEAIGVCGDSKNVKPLWTTLHTGPVPGDALLVETNIRQSLKFVGKDEGNSNRLAEQVPRANLLPSIKISVAGETGVRTGGNQACVMCEFTLHFIQQQLEDKHTKEDIENAVKSVCSRLPQDFREQCDDYVDAYGDQVIALLEQQIDPSILCPMLGLCPGKAANAVPLAITQSSHDVTCVACEFVMMKVKEILGDRKSEAAVRDALDKVCSVMVKPIDRDCQVFVDQNAIEVMQLIAAGVNPNQICKMLKLCPDKAMSGGLALLDASHQLPISRIFLPAQPHPVLDPTASLENSGQSKVCVMCEFVLNVLEHLVLDNNTHIEEEIERGVKQVCVHLPSTLQEDCLGFVEEYSRAIIELLVSKVSPAVVCREIKLCKPPALYGYQALRPAVVAAPVIVVPAEAEGISKERKCLICQAVETTQKGSSNEGGPAYVEQSLNNLCNGLDAQDSNLCLSLKQQLTGGSSTGLCGQYCPERSSRSLLGSDKCTWGPSYWCQSLLHSHSCGATTHCQEVVWQAEAPTGNTLQQESISVNTLNK